MVAALALEAAVGAAVGSDAIDEVETVAAGAEATEDLVGTSVGIVTALSFFFPPNGHKLQAWTRSRPYIASGALLFILHCGWTPAKNSAILAS